MAQSFKNFDPYSDNENPSGVTREPAGYGDAEDTRRVLGDLGAKIEPFKFSDPRMGMIATQLGALQSLILNSEIIASVSPQGPRAIDPAVFSAVAAVTTAAQTEYARALRKQDIQNDPKSKKADSSQSENQDDDDISNKPPAVKTVTPVTSSGFFAKIFHRSVARPIVAEAAAQDEGETSVVADAFHDEGKRFTRHKRETPDLVEAARAMMMGYMRAPTAITYEPASRPDIRLAMIAAQSGFSARRALPAPTLPLVSMDASQLLIGSNANL